MLARTEVEPPAAGADPAADAGTRPSPRQHLWRAVRTMAPVLNAAVPTLLTLLTIWYLLFPKIEELGAPEVRRVTITDVAFVEQRFGERFQVENVVAVEVQAEGYDADPEPIALDWTTLDPRTRQRLDSPSRWGTLDFDTRSDAVTALVTTHAPLDYPECVVVRVVAVAAGGTGGAGSETAGPAGHVLDLADTPPFDPDDPGNPACGGPAATPAAG